MRWRGAHRWAAVAAVVLIAAAGAARTLGQPVDVRFGRSEALQEQVNRGASAMLQDRLGFLWFAADNGLIRFDGADFTVFRHDPADSTSISDNWVLSLEEDERGQLWVGTRNRGLNRFDPETQEFTRIGEPSSGDGTGLRADIITALEFDAKGRLWVGTIGGGLSRLDPTTGRFTHFGGGEGEEDPFGSRVFCLFEDRSGDVWIGTWASGLARWDAETETFTFYRHDPDDPASLSNNRIRSIIQGQSGHLWIATSGRGLNRLDPKTGEVEVFKHDPGDATSISHNVVWSLFEDSRGNIWAGTFGGGLNKFDRGTGTFTRYRHDPADPSSLPSDVVVTLFEDRSGLLWVGTDAGMVKYNPMRERIAHFRHTPGDSRGLPRDYVLAIARSARRPQTFWIGTNGGGFSRFDLTTGHFTTYRHDPRDPSSLGHDVISAIQEDSTGRVWIGTKGGGLSVFDPATNGFERYRRDPSRAAGGASDVVTALLVDRRGDVWIGTDGEGLDRFDRARGVFRHYRHHPNDPNSIGYNSISALLEDGAGQIWIATTDAGLSRLEPETGRIVRYAHVAEDSTSLSHNRVQALFEDAEGRLWVGTYAGLNRYIPERDAFVHYTTREGLAGSSIQGITSDPEGKLWITTNRGASRLDVETGVVTNYGEASGLPDIRFSPGAIARSRRGEILLGGASGLSVFTPRVLEQEVYRPPIVITAFKKFGETAVRNLISNTALELTHRDSYFSLEFALLDYTSPGDHTFRYKLEGFDPGWQEVEGAKGRANYTNLDHRSGRFLFLVEGVDSKGRSNVARVWITIAPPWWRARWFRMLSLIGSVALAVAAIGFAYRRRRMEAAEKRRMLAEGREQERHLLARELHDVPLQNLYSVRHRLEVFLRSISLNGEQAHMEEAQRMVEQTAEDLRRICGELRPPALGPFGLSRAIRAHLRNVEQAHPEITVTFDLMPDGQQLPERVRLALFRIYQSALSNVIRHAEARRISVRLELTGREVILEVEDDGRGFVIPRNWLELARQQHYGLLGMSEWAEAVGGSFTVRSSPGEGAVLHVRVPLQREPRALRIRRLVDRLHAGRPGSRA